MFSGGRERVYSENGLSADISINCIMAHLFRAGFIIVKGRWLTFFDAD